jgi:hypothetical protein
METLEQKVKSVASCTNNALHKQLTINIDISSTVPSQRLDAFLGRLLHAKPQDISFDSLTSNIEPSGLSAFFQTAMINNSLFAKQGWGLKALPLLYPAYYYAGCRQPSGLRVGSGIHPGLQLPHKTGSQGT